MKFVHVHSNGRVVIGIGCFELDFACMHSTTSNSYAQFLAKTSKYNPDCFIFAPPNIAWVCLYKMSLYIHDATYNNTL